MFYFQSSIISLGASLSMILGLPLGCATIPITTFHNHQDDSKKVEANEIAQVDHALKWNHAELLHQLKGHQEQVTLLAFTPEGEQLATASSDAIRIWNVESGELLHELDGHSAATNGGEMKAPISDIAFSPDGNVLATASWSQGISAEDSLILWDVKTGTPRQKLAGEQGCRDIAFTPNSEQIWAACGRNVQLWSLQDGTQTQTVGEKPAQVVALTPDAATLATVDANFTGNENSRQVKLWDITANSPQLKGTLSSTDVIEAAQFSNDGETLITQNFAVQDATGSLGQVEVWDWQRRLSRYSHPYSGDFPASLSSDGTLLAGEFFKAGILIDIEGNPIEHSISTRQQGSASAIALSPSNDILAWAGQPPTFPFPIIRLWKASATSQNSGEEDHHRDYETIHLPDSSITEQPEVFAQNTYGLQETSGSTQQTISSEQPQPDQKIITLTQTNLKDDSVAAIRYRLEFTQKSDHRWELTWVGRQQQCRRGPTEPNEWTPELCL